MQQSNTSLEQRPDVLATDEQGVDTQSSDGPVLLDAEVLQFVSGGGPLGGWLGSD